MADSPSGVIERPTLNDPEVRGALFQEGRLDFGSIEAELGGPVPMDQLAPLGNVIARNSRNAQFWYGDLLVYARSHYPEEYAQLIDALGHAPQTILDMERVSKVFPAEDRLVTYDDRPGLTWHHHRVSVTFFNQDPDRCRSLMRQALDEQWPIRKLKIEINRVRNAIEVREASKAEGGEEEETTPASPAPTHTTFTISITTTSKTAPIASEVIDETCRVAVAHLQSRGVVITKSTQSISGAQPTES